MVVVAAKPVVARANQIVKTSRKPYRIDYARLTNLNRVSILTVLESFDNLLLLEAKRVKNRNADSVFLGYSNYLKLIPLE